MRQRDLLIGNEYALAYFDQGTEETGGLQIRRKVRVLGLGVKREWGTRGVEIERPDGRIEIIEAKNIEAPWEVYWAQMQPEIERARRRQEERRIRQQTRNNLVAELNRLLNMNLIPMNMTPYGLNNQALVLTDGHLEDLTRAVRNLIQVPVA